MVRLTNPNNILEEPNRWVGLSTDCKPTTAHNGDEFIEMDTSKQYMYNEEASEWVEITVSGGGGGGGNANLFVCRLTWDNGQYLCDKTLAEISEAYFSEIPIIAFENYTIGGTSVYTDMVANDDFTELVSITFHFWEPIIGVANHFGLVDVEITSNGSSNTYTEYVLTPAP